MRHSPILATCLLLGYLLGIHNGRVALWKAPDPEPVRVFPYAASLLPQDVRQALESGIRIETEAQLDQLLESLCS